MNIVKHVESSLGTGRERRWWRGKLLNSFLADNWRRGNFTYGQHTDGVDGELVGLVVTHLE